MSNKAKLQVKKIHLKRKVNGVMTDGYCGRIMSRGIKDFDQIIRDASNNTTSHRAEVSMAAELLLDEITRSLSQGYIVDLGPLGNLRLSVSSPWHINEEDVKLPEMKVNVCYRAPKSLKTILKASKLGWYNENSR